MKKVNILIIILITFVIASASTYAVALINSEDVFYDNTKSDLASDNVQDALDELYNKYKKNSVESKCESVATPVLKDELIPVTIADDGTVTRVSEKDSNWYNYCEKKWANAVILASGSYTVGQTIPESAIESYFVWIPKYKYKLWNVNVTTPVKYGAHSIDIVFDTTNTTDTATSCEAPLTSGASGNCQNGMYMTHPAFITMGINGFWVGKFETTGTTSAVTVKPNQNSLTNQTVQTYFNTFKNYKTNLNSHMMKNTEWGAVAYLSHSKYGIDGEININNNWNSSTSKILTGYSSLKTIQQGTYPGTYGNGTTYSKTYNTDIGYLASTTGNISGIYDMSGGAHEYMASYRSGAGSVPSADAKYFDVYSASSAETTYQYRILGDATGEMGPFVDYKDGDTNPRHHNQWYGDSSDFVTSSYPWFVCGGAYNNGVLAGQFDFSYNTGVANTGIGSRLVLAVD